MYNILKEVMEYSRAILVISHVENINMLLSPRVDYVTEER